ncbi:MAG TPA: flagellar basal-body rod protein FlgF [Steroidobacteraceae bacterium]|nr:flagellar basal-body rod protein FlgF [Steroidobacteraceae bacterium]
MLTSLYTALAGMNAYSRGLELISNNVANLNTPGFKVSDPLFREIVYRHLAAAAGNPGSMPGGAGVEVGATTMTFRQGELRDTGNALDAAIDGDGFFMLDEKGSLRYTRAGQFQFNEDGVLVERGSGAKVWVSTADSALGFFDIDDARTSPPKVTTEVTIVGTLARGGSTLSYELPNITVFDSAGTSIALKARLTRDAEDFFKWTVEVLDPQNHVVGTGEIKFAENGTPVEDASRVTVTVDATNVDDFDVVFDFGAAGSFAGVTSPAASTSSQLQVLRQDGLAAGSLTRTEFDDRGQLKLTYSNGKTEVVATLVLAQFDAPEQLQALGNGMFAAPEGATRRLGSGLSEGLGRIVGGRLEMSNVELTQQFTDLIIMQRGYQASSQISSVANELIQALLAMDGKR